MVLMWGTRAWDESSRKRQASGGRPVGEEQMCQGPGSADSINAVEMQYLIDCTLNCDLPTQNH
jgi:hypothetical protein